MKQYVTGLLLDGERKSISPMAKRLSEDSSRSEALRQRLQECVVISPWQDEELFRRLALKIDKELPGIEALVIDDTGFAKKGKHSVGVARQYSGTLARVGNCQVATSLHLSGAKGSVCIGMRLYLPDEWTKDLKRCEKAGVPEHIKFQKKWEIALDLLDNALDSGVRHHTVLADAGYGDCGAFRKGLQERELSYVVGVNSTHSVFDSETVFALPPSKKNGRGRPPSRLRSDSPPSRVKALAIANKNKFRKVTWKQGSKGPMSSKFFACRVRTGNRHHIGKAPGKEEWLLVQWPDNKEEPTRYWLSNLPKKISLRKLVYTAKLRWRIERDYQELKGEIGLDHFEGRQWRGFHHHAALCSLAHAFLTLQRALFPPPDSSLDDCKSPL